MGSRAWQRAAIQLLLTALVWTLAAGAARAQAPLVGAGDEKIPVDPIRCWWRTSAGAIRVGEPFVVVLTCAVIENDVTVVVPDQSKLEPAAVQLPPFEMLGGTPAADLRTEARRFFQYQYRLRVIQDDVFGEDVPLPELQIPYRVRSRMPDGSLVEGRDLVYILPATSVRVLSLVPADASDIRDFAHGTFSELDARAFRGNMLRMAGSVLLTLSGILAVLALVPVGKRFFRRTLEAQLIPDTRVLRQAGRELGAVRRLREEEGWSSALAGRALAALRIVGAYALAHRASQVSAASDANGHEGQVVVPGGWPGRPRVFVSGAVTAETVGRALGRADGTGLGHADLEQLQTALARFTALQYGRNGDVDEPALDESLSHGLGLARRLAIQHLWAMKKLHTLTGAASGLGRRLWAR